MATIRKESDFFHLIRSLGAWEGSVVKSFSACVRAFGWLHGPAILNQLLQLRVNWDDVFLIMKFSRCINMNTAAEFVLAT